MNIILIISDTFRYDNLFERASMPVRTPNLNGFAATRAVGASRFYTCSFPTIPHRTDLTTGRVGWPRYPWQDRRLSSKNHLPIILGQAGYVSQLICDCPHLFNAAFNTGFSAALHNRGQEIDLPFLRMNHAIEETIPYEKTRGDRHLGGHTIVDLSRWENRYWRGEADRFPPRTAALAVEWLEENYLHHPSFLWLDFFDPHEPWDPPEYMVRRYDPDYAGRPMLHPNYGVAGDLTPAELRNLRAHYCAEAELVDRWAGRVLEKIDDLNLWRNSIVVFTSDHGMSLGEHNRTGKTNINQRDPRPWPIYPEVAQVPFLVAAPGLKGGRSIDMLLQPQDILPTLLDLAGLAVETPEPLHGRSFAPALRGEAQPPIHDCAVSASHWRPAEPPAKQVTPMLYTTHWAYAPVGVNGVPELYDLRQDPYAERDVAALHPVVITRLQAQYEAWVAQHSEPAVPTGEVKA